MSVVMQTNPERRQNNKNLVAELKQERHQVWALYCKVAELKPFSCSTKTQELLNEFSQLLIDYVSLGHFGIYERLLSGNERRESVLNTAKNIYSEFSKTTEVAMAFNDKYDNSDHDFIVEKLESDLSFLGESLAKRIEYEDTLCRLVLN